MTKVVPEYVASFFAKRGQDIKIHKSFAFDIAEQVYTIPYTMIGDYSDGDQWGEASLTVEEKDGKYPIFFSAKFKNKRKFDGDTFRAIAAFVDADGKPLHKIILTRGLNAMCTDAWYKFTCTTQTGGKSDSVTLESFDGVMGVIIAIGYENTIDDKKFWKDVEKAAKKVKNWFDNKENKKKEDQGKVIERSGRSSFRRSTKP